MRKKSITVDGKKYEVVEDLGYQGGHSAKIVVTDEGEKTAVKDGYRWRFWTVADRLSGRALPRAFTT